MSRKGIGGHQSARAMTVTWLTPPAIIKALGPFDLDPCAAPAPRPWATAREHYALPAQDGLALPWHGRIWMNPPYGKALGAWMAKLSQHGTGTAMIFARTETEAFFRWIWQDADAVMFLRGRIHFHLPDGTRARENGGAPSVLVAYGRQDAERLFESGLEGKIVGLKAPALIHIALEAAPQAQGWRDLVLETLAKLGGQASLGALYDALESHPRAKSNQHWRAKVRQTVARTGLKRVARGAYEAAA